MNRKIWSTEEKTAIVLEMTKGIEMRLIAYFSCPFPFI